MLNSNQNILTGKPQMFNVNEDGESGDGQSPDNMLPL
jgi:hypothetical protein